MKHSGDKYKRPIRDTEGRMCFVWNNEAKEFEQAFVDVYSVQAAFQVVRPGFQHAIKKFLCAGIRGKGNLIQDSEEAVDAAIREVKTIKQEAEDEKVS